VMSNAAGVSSYLTVIAGFIGTLWYLYYTYKEQ
jgi:hypothetical protein